MCQGFPVFRFSGFPVFRFSGFPVFRFSGFPVFRWLADPKNRQSLTLRAPPRRDDQAASAPRRAASFSTV
jgi:hypothetical protein